MMPDSKPTLPCVAWGKHRISRLLIGHNPLKGGSHYSDELSALRVGLRKYPMIKKKIQLEGKAIVHN